MELLSSGINALVVGAVGVLLAWLGKGQFEALRASVDHKFVAQDQTFQARFDAIDQRFDAVDREFARVHTRIDRLEVRVDGLQASIDGMRSDLTQVALAVGAKPRAR